MKIHLYIRSYSDTQKFLTEFPSEYLSKYTKAPSSLYKTNTGPKGIMFYTDPVDIIKRNYAEIASVPACDRSMITLFTLTSIVNTLECITKILRLTKWTY